MKNIKPIQYGQQQALLINFKSPEQDLFGSHFTVIAEFCDANTNAIDRRDHTFTKSEYRNLGNNSEEREIALISFFGAELAEETEL